MADKFGEINRAAGDETGKTEPKARRVEYYDDLPPGFW